MNEETRLKTGHCTRLLNDTRIQPGIGYPGDRDRFIMNKGLGLMDKISLNLWPEVEK